MKTPVLHVKKGATVYDDALQEETPELPSETGGSRPGRRRGLLFLPLLVVVMAAAAVLQLSAPRNSAQFRGWTASLRAVPYGDMLLLSVTFTSRQGSAGGTDSTSPDGAQPAAAVSVMLPDTGQTIELSGEIAPPATTLRAQLPLDSAVRTVRAEIEIGGEKHSVTAGVPARR